VISKLLFAAVLLAFLVAAARWGLRGAFLFFCLAFPFAVFVDIGRFNLNTPEFASFMAIFLFAGILALQGTGPRLRRPILPYAPFLLYASASIPLLITSQASPRAFVMVARPLAFLALAVIGMEVVRNRADVEQVRRFVGYGVVAALALGVVEALTVQGFEDVLAWKESLSRLGVLPVTLLEREDVLLSASYTEGYTGVFPIHHAYAYFLGVVALFLFSRLLHGAAAKPGGAAAEAVILGLTIFLLLFTKSRTFQLALPPALVVGLVVLARRGVLHRLRIVLIAAVAVPGAIAFGELDVDRFAAAIALATGDPQEVADGSVLQRLDYQARSLELIRENPWFGAGFHSYGPDMGQSKPHNAYLHEWQLKGIVGVVGYLFLIGVLFALGWRGYRRESEEPVVFHFAMTFSVFVMVAGLGSAVINDVRAAIPLVLAYVAIHALEREGGEGHGDESPEAAAQR
jgi:O-antigen ligase